MPKTTAQLVQLLPDLVLIPAYSTGGLPRQYLLAPSCLIPEAYLLELEIIVKFLAFPNRVEGIREPHKNYQSLNNSHQVARKNMKVYVLECLFYKNPIQGKR